jgi:sugar-specific transcriptional regulator TrmB
MEPKDLVPAGLTENQAKVYLKILNHPGQTGSGLGKISSIDRSFVYNIIEALINKGLVSHITKDGVRRFYPANPENLLKDIDEKREIILRTIEELKTIKEINEPEKSVSIYEGKAGLKAYITDLLSADSFLTFGGGDKFSLLDALRYSYPKYLKKLNEVKIRGNLITSAENLEQMKELYQNSKVDIKTIKGLKNSVSFTIFNDKIAIYSAEEKPFAIIIHDKNTAKALGDYFKILWARID